VGEKLNKEYKLILASGSPRRREILEKMGLEFEIIPSSYEEFLESSDFSYEKIEDLAYNKAKSVIDRCKSHSLILGADTVVVLDGRILGKPQNKKEALAMLRSLSGKKHSVVTSICTINSKSLQKETLSATSYVEFEELTEEKIKDYVEKYNPLDKAGSYGIQELPAGFVKNIEGSFENIIGLCPSAVGEILKNF